MVSEVSICNQALGWLGQDPLTSLNDQNVRGDLCRANYPVLRDAVLESRTWTFALRREKSVSVDTDPWESAFQHKIDDDWLLILRVFDTPPGGSGPGSLEVVLGPQALNQTQWYREGDYIYTPSEVAYLWGLRRLLDPTKYTEGFRQALAARIAADLAVPLTQNRQLQADMWGLYESKLAEAATRDGQQGRNEKIDNSRLVGVRAGV